MKRLFAGIIAITLSACATAPKPVGQPPATVMEAIEQATADTRARRDPALPSLLVGVSRGASREFAVFGEPSLKDSSVVPATAITKPLTALLLASYVAEGTVSLDDKIGVGSCGEDQLSSFCFHGTATTYQHLVQHTAGLPADVDGARDGYSSGDLQDFLANFQLSIEPGKRFRQSDAGYAALGMAMARHTRQPYVRGLTTRVLPQLGLDTMTFMPAPGALYPGVADGTPVNWTPDPEALWPGGSIAANADEMLRLAEIHLHPDDNALVEAIRLTQRVSSGIEAADGSTAANGWLYLERLDTYWQSGSTPGYATFVAFSPRADAAVVMVANTAIEDDRLAEAAFRLIETLPSR